MDNDEAPIEEFLTATLAGGLLAGRSAASSRRPVRRRAPAPGSAASIGATPLAAAAPPRPPHRGGRRRPRPRLRPDDRRCGATVASLKAAGFRDCGPAGLIDDGEDGNNQNIVGADCGGYWYTFRDKKGTTVEPVAGEDGGAFTMSEGGHASKLAARFHGKVGTGAPLFARHGDELRRPEGGLRRLEGRRPRLLGPAAPRARPRRCASRYPTSNTDPEGGVCTECFYDFGGDSNLTTEWKLYVFPWTAMKQMPGWGSPRKPHIVPVEGLRRAVPGERPLSRATTSSSTT